MSTFPDGQTPDKSNFTQTCNLLNQFLKEKRSSATTLELDLLTNLQYADDASPRQKPFLPRLLENPCINLRSSVIENPQLTIFYAGKVLVFDAFPPEKATEVMELATKLGSGNSGHDKIPPSASATVATENLKAVKVPRSGSLAFGSDMRYPRRASLLKFLEKRKERVIARRPYQMNNHKHECHSSKDVDLNL